VFYGVRLVLSEVEGWLAAALLRPGLPGRGAGSAAFFCSANQIQKRRPEASGTKGCCKKQGAASRAL
jgi:hypothetical protein